MTCRVIAESICNTIQNRNRDTAVVLTPNVGLFQAVTAEVPAFFLVNEDL